MACARSLRTIVLFSSLTFGIGARPDYQQLVRRTTAALATNHSAADQSDTALEDEFVASPLAEGTQPVNPPANPVQGVLMTIAAMIKKMTQQFLGLVTGFKGIVTTFKTAVAALVAALTGSITDFSKPITQTAGQVEGLAETIQKVAEGGMQAAQVVEAVAKPRESAANAMTFAADEVLEETSDTIGEVLVTGEHFLDDNVHAAEEFVEGVTQDVVGGGVELAGTAEVLADEQIISAEQAVKNVADNVLPGPVAAVAGLMAHPPAVAAENFVHSVVNQVEDLGDEVLADEKQLEAIAEEQYMNLEHEVEEAVVEGGDEVRAAIDGVVEKLAEGVAGQPMARPM